jgi:hypothetical protein
VSKITKSNSDLNKDIGIDDNATSTAITIDSNEKVGIGTNSPAGILHLDEGAADDCRLIAETHAGGDSMILFTQGASGAGTPTWGIGLDATNDVLSIGFEDTGYNGFSLTSDSKFVIDTSGNVGIGTTAPTNSSGYSTLSLNGSTGGQLAFQTGSSGKHFIYSSSTALNIHSAAGGELRFQTNGANERMRIDSSGQLIMGGSSGVAQYYNRIDLVGNTSYTFDITVPNEGGQGNTFLVECGYSHYFGAFYNTHLHGWYSARGTSISAMGVLLNQNTTYAGAWSVSKPTSTTLRLTKSAGTGAGGGRGFIKVTWAK